MYIDNSLLQKGKLYRHISPSGSSVSLYSCDVVGMEIGEIQHGSIVTFIELGVGAYSPWKKVIHGDLVGCSQCMLVSAEERTKEMIKGKLYQFIPSSPGHLYCWLCEAPGMFAMVKIPIDSIVMFLEFDKENPHWKKIVYGDMVGWFEGVLQIPYENQ